ncbi:GSCFA domain-containing protein [Rhodopseudomonas palustris]|uniref:GSCFA family protein n=1 Tax=Rhodopseudomonas palustris TaxID=1076 RepID=A0A418UY03_RHOPL|nr:GSCFA domain-containing protein [Rhodopseudomonas palustris]RJF67314.1 GSCFA family protein [Rhodopseudomonas palustris]
MARNPYHNLGRKAYWKSALSQDGLPINIYRPKWPILPSDKIMTAGSCFAQHIGHQLRRRGFQVLDAEPAPENLPKQQYGQFGFGMFSARYGNVYTTRQLLQLLRESLGLFSPTDAVWQAKDGGFCDALRPSIEPSGFDSEDEVRRHREYHLRQVRDLMRQLDVFIFTFGLTEVWEHHPSGTVYPSAPGTIAGSFDPSRHRFRNLSFSEVLDDFEECRKLIRAQQPNARFLVTVSPVPLAATATSNHVMVATSYSKSTLRSVAGLLADRYDDVDYFPSYEIITNSWSSTVHYTQNLRDVRPESVEHVMATFFAAHAHEPIAPLAPSVRSDSVLDNLEKAEDEIVCDEAILAAFAPPAGAEATP